MKNTAIALLESTMIPSVDLMTKNAMEFNRLEKLSEAANQRLGFIAEKVVVVENPDNHGNYMIEFSGNLERLMQDQVLDLTEAVTAVAEANNISVLDCIVVFDESVMNKVDLSSMLKDESIEYNFARI